MHKISTTFAQPFMTPQYRSLWMHKETLKIAESELSSGDYWIWK